MARTSHYLAKNRSNNLIIGDQIKVASSFFSRFRGLLGTENLAAGEGLLITKCRQVHLFLMKFALDLIFLDKDQTVIFIELNKKPWTISKSVPKAVSVLEVAAGAVSTSHTYVGDQLSFERAQPKRDISP